MVRFPTGSFAAFPCIARPYASPTAPIPCTPRPYGVRTRSSQRGNREWRENAFVFVDRQIPLHVREGTGTRHPGRDDRQRFRGRDGAFVGFCCTAQTRDRRRESRERYASLNANNRTRRLTSFSDRRSSTASLNLSNLQARVVARETLSSIPPTALSWGNEDEDDVTRAATAATPSANQAGTSRPSAGGWAKRFGGTKEKETKKKAASVANMSRAEKRAANGYEKQHTKDAKEMNVTCATNAARKESRESQEMHEIQPCAIDATTFGAPARRAETTRSSSRSVSFSFLVVLVFKILVAAIVAFALFLAAVYLDSNFPEAWPEMWRMEQHVNNLSASEALAFALGVVQDLVGETKKAVTAATALAIREKNALAVALTKKTVRAIAKLRAESEFVTAHVTRFATSARLVFADRVRTAKTLFDEAKAFASRKAGR